MAKKDLNGTWVTIDGRHIFIEDSDGGKEKKEDQVETQETKTKDLTKKATGKEKIKGSKEKETIQEKYGLKDKRNEYDVSEYEQGKIDQEELTNLLTNQGESKETIQNIIDKNKGIQLSDKQIEAGNKLHDKALEGAKSDIKQYMDGGAVEYNGNSDDFIKDLSKEWAIDESEAKELVDKEIQTMPSNDLKTAYDSIDDESDYISNKIKERYKLETGVGFEDHNPITTGKKGTPVKEYTSNFHLEAPVNDYDEAQAYLTSDDMTQYVPEELKDAITSAEWTMDDDESGHVTIKTNRELTDSEQDILNDWIDGQNSDGLGEGFEQQDFATSYFDPYSGDGPFTYAEAERYVEDKIDDMSPEEYNEYLGENDIAVEEAIDNYISENGLDPDNEDDRYDARMEVLDNPYDYFDEDVIYDAKMDAVNNNPDYNIDDWYTMSSMRRDGNFAVTDISPEPGELKESLKADVIRDAGIEPGSREESMLNDLYEDTSDDDNDDDWDEFLEELKTGRNKSMNYNEWKANKDRNEEKIKYFDTEQERENAYEKDLQFYEDYHQGLKDEFGVDSEMPDPGDYKVREDKSYTRQVPKNLKITDKDLTDNDKDVLAKAEEEFGIKLSKGSKSDDEEYAKYKEVRSYNPERHDQMMKDNSYWQGLDKKYNDRYNKDIEEDYEKEHEFINQYLPKKDKETTTNETMNDIIRSKSKKKNYTKDETKDIVLTYLDEDPEELGEIRAGYDYMVADRIANKYKIGKQKVLNAINRLEKKDVKGIGKGTISDAIRRKAYEKYLKEHPNSKMKYEDFVK